MEVISIMLISIVLNFRSEEEVVFIQDNRMARVVIVTVTEITSDWLGLT
jgi:hypothetical protein